MAFVNFTAHNAPKAAPYTPPPTNGGAPYDPGSGSDAGFHWFANASGAPDDYSGLIGATVGRPPMSGPPQAAGPASAGPPVDQPTISQRSPYQTDPGYQASVALEQQGLGQLDAALKAARERAIIDFGDPSMASMAGFGLDPQAAAFARQNYLSGNAQLARFDKSHDLARQAVINQLASHGILASGDLGYKEGVVDQGYGNDVYDAKQKLLDYLNGVTSQDLQSRQQLHGGVIGAIQQAYQNFLSHPELYPAYPDQNSDGTGAATTANAGQVAAGRVAAFLGANAPHVSVPVVVAHHPAVQHRLNAYTSGQKRTG